jgi:CubicO group peptidase (beta-lactamase class C family)
VKDAATAGLHLQDDLTAILQRAIGGRVFPGAVVAVVLGQTEICVAVGRETYDALSPVVQTTALFDVASLTKIVATATAVLQLVEAGRLSLADRAALFLPRLSRGRSGDITIRQLLTHTAGFPGPYEFFRFCKTREALIDAIYGVPLASDPGSARLYDDIGFVLLALIVEKIAECPFEEYCARYIFGPLQMQDTMFRPQAFRGQIIPTEVDVDRGGLLRGVVHDENAYVLGGIAGHAGLFSTAADLTRFARMMAGLGASASVLTAASIVRVRECEWREGADVYGLGWDKIRPYMGALADADTIGHTGFTGTSMVVSPSGALAVTLLSNRIYPKRSDPTAVNAVRAQVADAVARHVAGRGV